MPLAQEGGMMHKRATTGMRVLLVLLPLLFAGCVATTPAPVTQRSVPGKPPAVSSKPEAAAVVKAEAPPPPKPEAGVVVTPLSPSLGPSYTVRQGDTLFSIARAHNVPLRDFAAWNNLEIPYVITIGQQLRLTPPDGVALPPVGPQGAAAGTPAAADSNIKTQPLGQRVPYSELAYAQMTRTPLPVKPEVTAESKPEAKAEIKAENKPEPKADSKTGSAAETRTDTKADARSDKPRADGTVAWAWPAQGQVVGSFNEGSNKGIAIAGKRGQPVHASAAGRVIFSGSGIRGLGNLVVIRHNSTYLSVYAHNDKLLVKQGQNVHKGQHIADMGNSDADRVKLHFEIRRQGKPVDPLKLLPEH